MRRNERLRKELCSRIWDYLSMHPCVDCKEDDPMVLTFDHVRGKKKADVSHMVLACYSWESIVDEISKCDIRCANCHMRRTAIHKGFWKSKVVGLSD